MTARQTIWNIIKWILKLIIKLSLMLLWGGLRIIEVILAEVNKLLKNYISKKH
jgi:hypothetical protein